MAHYQGKYFRGKHTTYIDDATKFIKAIVKIKELEGISFGEIINKKGQNSLSRSVKIITIGQNTIRLIVSSKSSVQDITVFIGNKYQDKIINTCKQIAGKNGFNFIYQKNN